MAIFLYLACSALNGARSGVFTANNGPGILVLVNSSVDFEFELQQSAQQTQTATETVTQLEDKLSALKQQLDQVSQSAAAPDGKEKLVSAK